MDTCSTCIFIAGGVFFLGKVPERFWNPDGLFNTLNSHVWHHIWIVIAIYYAFNAIPMLYLLEHEK